MLNNNKAVNCWEYKSCGREPGGRHCGDQGVCPVPVSHNADGINGGMNGGRACWMIAGTLCFGEKQGTFAKKLRDCACCDFAQTVMREQGSGFEKAEHIYRKLQSA